MRTRKLSAALSALIVALGLAACGGDDTGAAPEVKQGASFPAGSTMQKLQQAGSIKIGVKVDQPGLGYKNPATGKNEGFDIEIAKIVAASLGVAADKIAFTETVSKNREPFIQQGTVDIVVASYSITDERRKVVSQAGPYYVTGQQLLVREEDKSKITGPDNLKGIKVCSVTGSTSIKNVEEKYGAQPAPFATYTECVQQLTNGSVDAVTTDGSILLGYAALQPDKLEVVGEPFSEERYGIGFEKGDTAFCDHVRKTIQAALDDGTWEKAYKDTLGKSGAPTPAKPTLDPTC